MDQSICNTEFLFIHTVTAIIRSQVVPGPEGGEEDDLLDAGLPRHQHGQPVHAQPEPRRRRQAVLQDAREGLVVLGGRLVVLVIQLLGGNSTENWHEFLLRIRVCRLIYIVMFYCIIHSGIHHRGWFIKEITY